MVVLRYLYEPGIFGSTLHILSHLDYFFRAENRTQGFLFSKHAPGHRVAYLASPVSLNLDQNH